MGFGLGLYRNPNEPPNPDPLTQFPFWRRSYETTAREGFSVQCSGVRIAATADPVSDIFAVAMSFHTGSRWRWGRRSFLLNQFELALTDP